MPPTIAQATAGPAPDSLPWIGGILLVLALLASSLAVVPRGQRRVVTRRGQVRRIFESGIAWRAPLIERVVLELSEGHEMPFSVRATTIDRVPVLVLAEAEVRILPPPRGGPYADPWPAAERAAEDQVRALVVTLPVTELRHALRAAERPLLRSIGSSVRPLGVEMLGFEVVEIDLPLTSNRGPD